ncbi:MAG: tetratricopeptide repeat protein [Bacteroidota bacterium]
MLESYCEKPHTSIEFKFMLGSTYLEEGRIQRAIDSFTPLVDYQSARIRHNALWYLSIAYIKQGNHKRADELLAQLLKESGPNADSASELRLLLDV